MQARRGRLSLPKADRAVQRPGLSLRLLVVSCAGISFLFLIFFSKYVLDTFYFFPPFFPPSYDGNPPVEQFPPLVPARGLPLWPASGQRHLRNSTISLVQFVPLFSYPSAFVFSWGPFVRFSRPWAADNALSPFSPDKLPLFR